MKLKHIFFTLAATVLFSTAQAQVKVGANPGTIESTSALEVEATNGNKTTINKTNGQVTIKDGTQGAGKVLTSDANGVASWVAGATIGLVNGTFISPVPNLSPTWTRVAQITLPAGKWLIFWRITYLNISGSNANPYWDLTTLSTGYNATTNILGRGLGAVAIPGWFGPATVIYDADLSSTTTLHVWGSAGVTLQYSGEARIFAVPVAN